MKGSSSELVRCKTSVHAIGTAIVLFLIGSILIITAIYEFQKCQITNNTSAPSMSDIVCSTDPVKDASIKDMVSNEVLAGSVFVGVALLTIFIAVLASLRFKCFKTAAAGTLLGFLLIL